MIAEKYIRMLDKTGFCDLFWEKWKTGAYKRHEDAYEALEAEYFEYFGIRKYKNFQSFRRRRD